jgi:hypothetical protein
MVIRHIGTSPLDSPEPGTRISADPIVCWLPRVRGYSCKEIGAAKWTGVETLLSLGGFLQSQKYFRQNFL